ncbi:MAG: carboxypeptidase-like regulatory domain-containing protein [Saprospiraceae bacterium]|nr:carboxypeptidase-like regulatory domain-containing protein [Saprospiraceae bacterium]
MSFSSICGVPLLLLPLILSAQKPLTPKSPPKTALDSMMLKSSAFIFKQSSVSPDTTKATLRVRVLEKGGDTEPVHGATVLLRRDKDKILGRVTKNDGRCLFGASPATYTVRVQMTGLKSLEKSGITLDAGKVYDLEIMMARY